MSEESQLSWLTKLLSATDSSVSPKLVAYIAVVVAGIVWLSVDMAIKEVGGGHRGIDASWDTAFGLLLTAVTAAKMKSSGDTP